MRAPALTIFGLATFAFVAGDAGAADLGGGTIEIEIRLPDPDNEGEFVDVVNEIDRERFFNRANCECNAEFQVRMSLAGSSGSVENDEVELWVGNNCTDIEIQPMDCCSRQSSENFGTCPSDFVPFDTPALVGMIIERQLPVSTLIDPNDGECDSGSDGLQGTSSVWALIDDEKDGVYELDYNLPITFDTKPPPRPTDISLSAGEGALIVEWDLPAGNEDVEEFQVLCQRADGSNDPADMFPRDGEPAYLLGRTVCGIDDGITIEPLGGPGGGADAGADDAGAGDAGPAADAGPAPDPDGITSLDPMFLCGDAAATESSIRVDGLENGVEYRAILVVADRARNARFIDLGTGVPASVTDFWEDYKGSGGNAKGGCFVATAAYGSYDHPYVLVLRDLRDRTLARFAAGRAFIDWYYEHSPALAEFIEDHPVARAAAVVALFPVVIAAGVWEYTGALGKLGLVIAFAMAVHLRRRRRAQRPAPVAMPRPVRRRLAVAAAATVALAIVLAASSASAQSAYWEDMEDPVQEKVGAATAYWNFELKFGPYRPDVDSEFDMEPGPFERMYGDGPFLMSQIELQRFFLVDYGQLGVGLTVGFLRKSASAFELDENGMPDYDNRASGDKTSFHLFPLALTAVYRLSILDDRWGIPVVPFGKFGPSYYAWFVTKPSGGIAEAPDDDCPEPDNPASDCEGDRARGGSWGWQGTVGLAVRAERLDPDTEVGLRTELGISHAGIFAELTYAKVDGFGSDTKLSVGDLTWFGGINFEF